MRAVDQATERERNAPARDDTYPWPHDLNRPWLLPPSGTPYPVESNPGSETLIEKWRDLVAARDALVARIEAGDTRAQPELTAFDRQLATYPKKERFDALVREQRAKHVDAAMSALEWVLKQVRARSLKKKDAESDGDVLFAAEACRVSPAQIVEVVFHRDTTSLLADKGEVQAAALALEALGPFGSASTIFRRRREHRARERADAKKAKR